MSNWERLRIFAESVHDRSTTDEAKTNWNRIQQKRRMQTQGTTDRREKQGPMSYFNPRGTGSAQRNDTAAAMTPDMTPRPGGISIPAGSDRPSQGNPLFDPPTKVATGSRPNVSVVGADQDEDELDSPLPDLSKFVSGV